MAKSFVVNLIKDGKRIASIFYENGGYYDESIAYLTDLSNRVVEAENNKEDAFVSIYRYLVANGGGMRNTVMDKNGFLKYLPTEIFQAGSAAHGLMTMCQGGLESYDGCENYADINLDNHNIEHNVLPEERQAEIMEEDQIDPFHFTCETAQEFYEYTQSLYPD